MPMKPLILTSLSGLSLADSGLAEVVIPFTFRFGWGPLPSVEALAAYIAARTDKLTPGAHWSDFIRRPHRGSDLSLVEFCRPYGTVELWFDPNPENQLQLIWLLDGLRSDPETVAKLRLRLVDFDLIVARAEQFGTLKVHDVAVTEAELETASMSWQAYRATTPEACLNLVRRDLSALPLLRPVLVELLEELPSVATGLGATEMRLLELVANGYAGTNSLFYLRQLHQRRVFNSWETGFLLEGLAHGPRPALAGLDDAIRTLDRENCGGRGAAYLRSRLSITEFGKSVLAYQEDFSRHNPINRWWGGTRLTNDCLWCWDPVLTAPAKR